MAYSDYLSLGHKCVSEHQKITIVQAQKFSVENNA